MRKEEEKSIPLCFHLVSLSPSNRHICQLCFVCFTSRAGISKTILIEVHIFCLSPILGKTYLEINYVYVCVFNRYHPLKKTPFILNLVSLFLNYKWILSFILVIYCITLFNFQMLNSTCIHMINPIWS